jgi:hypothetical protein
MGVRHVSQTIIEDPGTRATPFRRDSMNRQFVLGVLGALCAAAAAQPAAAQSWDRWDRRGVGVSVGLGSPGYYDYAYGGYGTGCTCASPGYSYRTERSYPAYSSYAYAGYPDAGYGYSGYSYAYDTYPGYGYASVGIGITDRSWRGSRYGYSARGYAVRERDFDRGTTVRTRAAAFRDADSRTRLQGRGDFSRREVQGSVRENGGLRERSAAAVRSGGGVEGRALATGTEGRASGARARIDAGTGGRPMRSSGETR